MLFPGQLQCSDSRSMDVVNQGKCEGRPTFVCPVFFPLGQMHDNFPPGKISFRSYAYRQLPPQNQPKISCLPQLQWIWMLLQAMITADSKY